MSCSGPSSQKTAGLDSWKKKKGMTGKKKPRMMPLSMEAVRDGDCVPVTLSMESIHCSSNARACSSSVTVS